MTKYGFSLMCELHDPRSLVEQAKRAEQAGFDRVVPRSRMAREGPALVEALASA